MTRELGANYFRVIRRIGGLEMYEGLSDTEKDVIRRIGGLEICGAVPIGNSRVIRRIGGLEN